MSGRSGGDAERRGAVRPLVDDPLGGEPVDVRRLHDPVAVRRQARPPRPGRRAVGAECGACSHRPLREIIVHRLEREVFITCAVTGAGDTAGRCDKVPVTPPQIAAAAIEAARPAPRSRTSTCATPRPARARATRSSTARWSSGSAPRGVDVVLNLTAGMGGDLVLGGDRGAAAAGEAGTDMAGATERLAHVEELLPEICTLDCGTMNFAAGGDYVMTNTPGDAEGDGARRSRTLGVRPELEVFDTGHLVLRKELIAQGLIDDPGDDPALHGHPVGRARRPRHAAGDGQPAAAGLDLLGLLDRPQAAALRRRWRCSPAATSASGSRTTSGSRAGELATNGAAGRAGGRDPRGHERARARPRRGAREAGAERRVAEPRRRESVGLLGGGVIGGGWAARFLLNGVDVAALRPRPRGRAQGRRGARRTRAAPTRGSTSRRCRRRAADVRGYARGGGRGRRLRPGERARAARPQARAARRDRAAAPPTSSSAPRRRGSCRPTCRRGMAHPERLVVGHPFNPVYLLPLVEISAASDRAETVERAAAVYTSSACTRS